MDAFDSQVDTFSQTKDETNFPRWLSSVLGMIKKQLNSRAKLLFKQTKIINQPTAGTWTAISQNIPQGNFTISNTGIKIKALGNTINNVDTKTINFNFGGVSLFSYSLSINAINSWIIEIDINYDGNNYLVCYKIIVGSGITSNYATLTGIQPNAANGIPITLNLTAANAGDFSLYDFELFYTGTF